MKKKLLRILFAVTCFASSASAAAPHYTLVSSMISADTFARPDQDGWGKASDGHIWMDDAARYPGVVAAIKGNRGYADTFTAKTDRDQWMGADYTDQLVSADFNVLQFGQDNFQHGARLLGRVTDGHHFINFTINYATSTLQLWVNNNEDWRMMKQVSMPKFTVGQWYHAKLLTIGNMSYGKVWAFNATEPDWQISGSQNALKSGMGGVRSTFCNVYWSNFKSQAVKAE